MDAVEPLPPTAGKRAWRAWARGRRIDQAAWSAAACTALSRWEPFVNAGTVGAYRAFGRFEANLDPLVLNDPRVVHPRISMPDPAAARGGAERVTRTWARPSRRRHAAADDSFVQHPLGMWQPNDTAQEVDPRTIDVVLVPGVTFDRRGTRLGRGGGHYDRLLAGLGPDACIVGITHPDLLVADGLPREPHDVPMTHLLVLDAFVPIESPRKLSGG